METNQLLTYSLFFIAGIIITYIIMRLSKKDDRNITPATMSSAVIKNMISNYRNKQLDIINTTLGINDAQSVWFNMEVIKNFVSSVENESRKVNPNISEKDLGIRFYYAAYPEERDWDENFRSVRKDYAERHTLIMIPTLNKKGDHGELMGYDFNPLDRSTYSLDRKNKEHSEMKMIAVSSSNSESSNVMGQNHGQIIPPNDPVVTSY